MWRSISPSASDLRATNHDFNITTSGGDITGFRVATLIPEPASITLCLAGLLMLALKRTRR
jgi:hypothetical protein